MNNDYDKTWDEFWKPIVTNEDGTLNVEQIKKELHDFKEAMSMVSKVYDNVTGGRYSNILSNPDRVIKAAKEINNGECEECGGTGQVGGGVDISDYCPCPFCS